MRTSAHTAWLSAGVGCWLLVSAFGVFGQSIRIVGAEPDGTVTVSNSPPYGWALFEDATNFAAGVWNPATNLFVTGSASSVQLVVDTGGPDAYTVRVSFTPNLVLVSNGAFSMGDAYGEGEGDEGPVHVVPVSAFAVDRFEVSNDAMRAVLQWAYDAGKVSATPATVQNTEGSARELVDLDDPDSDLGFVAGTFVVVPGRELHPCREVSWYGAQAYCNYRSDIEQLDRCVDFTDWHCDFGQDGYRLPTEAEWEKAARGGAAGHHYPWDSLGGSYTNHIDGSRANYLNSGDPFDNGTSPVGYYDGAQTPAGPDQANGYAIHDTAGNVFEWCHDYYQANWYDQPGATATDTAGPTNGVSRVLRGGAWNSIPIGVRCANRDQADPETTSSTVGFRSVRSY